MPNLKRNSRSLHLFPLWAVVTLVLASAAIASWLLVRHSWSVKVEPPSDGDRLPQTQANVFSNYAGSASCLECHRAEYGEWADSHHGLAERTANSNTCQVAFEKGKTSGHPSPPIELTAHDGTYAVITSSADAKREAYTVDGVIGRDPLIQFLVATSGGKRQALSAAWDVRRQEWFSVFGAEERQPEEWGHWMGRGMNWNSMCAFCHNTRLLKNYDPDTDAYHTAKAELSVGCEACHGPVKSHVEWQHRYGKSGGKDPTLSPMSRQQKLDTCGACHSRRSELAGDFKPGDDFMDDFELAMVDGSNLYYPDGQVHEEDYEYASFLGSRMQARGVECSDCHQPHSAKTRLPGNFLCLRCHNGSYSNAPVIDPMAHSHHRVHGYAPNGKALDADLSHFKPEAIKETGGECINCHMPQTVYMQRHARRDHGFTIPDPLLTKEDGIPNACNRCHQNKDADWALAQVDKWYGKRMERPRRQRARRLAEARAGHDAAVEPLLKTLTAETNSYWKAAIINVLQPWSAEPRVDAVLRQSLNDSNALVREKAVRALDVGAENQTGLRTEALRARLEDPVRSVRVAAAWALRASLDTNSRAGRDLDLFFEVNVDQPGGQLQKGEFFVARGDAQQALEDYRKAVAWDPSSAAIRRDLAVLYGSLNQNREALEQLREAVRLEPREADYHFSLGLALNEVGESEKAIAELREAVRLNPRLVDGWRNLGLALAAKEDLSGALDALTRAEGVDANDPRIPYARATVLARLGKIAEARTAAEHALDLRPDYPEAQQLLKSLAEGK